MQAINSALGRNVGLRIALYDLFVNKHHIMKQPIMLEDVLLEHKEECAFKDSLTGLYNRRYFNQEVPREIERFRRFGIPFSLLMLDLDRFKHFNDNFGHLAGDEALKTVAEVLSNSARIYDRIVRYGGEEFAIILPQASRKEALVSAERIRAAVEWHPIFSKDATWATSP